MANIIELDALHNKVPNHLWHCSSRNRFHYSKDYMDTTKCFETMFNSRQNVSKDENLMMVTHYKTSCCDTHQSSYFVCEQNTSEENVIGSKYLLVPSQISAGYPGSTLQNSHILTHQHSLPNHHVGYHRGSVAERSSSIISEHSVTSETPPMIGGKCSHLS